MPRSVVFNSYVMRLVLLLLVIQRIKGEVVWKNEMTNSTGSLKVYNMLFWQSRDKVSDPVTIINVKMFKDVFDPCNAER